MKNYKDMAIINERKLKEQIEELEAKIDELEAQFGYECECNKELVATQNANERLKVLLYNAMIFISEELYEDDEQKWFENMLGMTEKEYKEIMGE